MDKREIIERLKNIARHAVHIVGEEPFVMNLDDGIAVNEAIELLKKPERKDAVEKAVAVEAISDELMSRFDISATYAYDVAESAVNRIEAMAKELEGGKQE